MFSFFNTLSFRSFISLIMTIAVYVSGYGRYYLSLQPKAPVIDETSTISLQAAQAFMNSYWDSNKKTFYCFEDNRLHPEHTSGPHSGLYTDFWWEAQLCEMVMDTYEKTGEKYYLKMIDSVFAGFTVEYGDWRNNNYNDDIAWWAMAYTHAYEITGNRLYLAEAKEMFDFIFDDWDDLFGGGIYWKNTHDPVAKMACINCPAMIIAARLGCLLKDKSYTDKAVKLYDWIDATLIDRDTGKVYDHISGEGFIDKNNLFSYNAGTFAEGSYDLFLATGDEKYRTASLETLDWFIEHKSNSSGILAVEYNGDGACFKPIFFHALKRIAIHENNPDYIAFINRNAQAAWSTRRLSDGLMTANWTVQTADNVDIYSAQASAAVIIIQLSTDLQQVCRPERSEGY